MTLEEAQKEVDRWIKTYGVDLTEAFHRNLEKKTNRDKDRHKNNPKL